MKPDLYWIPGPWRGRLAILGRPRGWDWLEDEAADWKSAGLDAVISLLENDEATELGLAQEDAAAKAHQIHFYSYPIPDRSVPASMSQIMELLESVESELKGGNSIGVHCRQSVGRSSMVAIALLMIGGYSLGTAQESVEQARGLKVPETASQMAWLEEFASRYSPYARTPQTI